MVSILRREYIGTTGSWLLADTDQHQSIEIPTLVECWAEG